MNSTLPSRLPVAIIRGGTSRAVFCRLRDLPEDPHMRDELCLRLIGSPDPVAIDGLGGGVSSNSKVMFVGTAAEARERGLRIPAELPAEHLISFFAQVSPAEPRVDWRGQCGNISAAISAYALAEGLCSFPDTATEATLPVYNANTGMPLELHHPLDGGRFPTSGDFVLDGVPGSAARVDLRFLLDDVPFRTTEIEGLMTTLIDVANPVAIVRAADIGVDVRLSPAELNADSALLERLEALRQAAGRDMGVENSAVIPRVAIVEPLEDGAGLRARMTSVGIIHHALPGTGLLALGAARTLGAPVIDLPPAEETRIEHPKGEATVSAHLEGERLRWVALARSARIILRGEVELRGDAPRD
ncbi:hypothetical protein L1O03_07350 [Corynebacterium uropygiale]|uniref:3-methylitaconate isomerase n=1 Tax=Corynebacterium uropygiale TaxID=1775911 RepID=A0A9X1U0P0_9CORY|nr:PrpF domain-containing protein [Corynebacterium uropygiale]MCF4006994.1 hypothetical protein [Corynebacterium uropygiale]